MILSIETATDVCSVALHNEGQLLASFALHLPQAHGKHLASLIDKLKQELSLDLRQLSAIAVSKGPGSYTGLRIGVATAKGLCYALQKPLIAVNTLEAMAYSARQYNLIQDAWICPMIDARRMEVYCMLIDHRGKVQSPTEAKIIDKDSFSELLSERYVIFCGNGMPKCRSLLEKRERALFMDHVVPHAEAVGALAWQRFQEGAFEDVAYFEPFYLKDFIAGKPKSKINPQ
ncbi:MAG: tRNA (adenosine(37)-N6)-threonylcarbamoyltransferase complex dimerization subunit type 1 TsaB [Thermonema sp.]|uniref:tRNA (adenosine(37)-N6)-threonylcarbamoyltransferase complex dimerization subunit type 1 TsaB n=1 Tax=Thermonema sp. TaxID=2231181 RepID=UPI0021DE5F48|nr:tRNA (adenosine(37)-N6)-threonylcarbamoyltransferase complex dimerization subunit type 1 TsaB [Thermonema sp.]GIV39303.1 MAG: tRNA (adenosine(37)-N6)-threonylcarbamoyltransferase complex dimerization subunit type 1 TsaB [Thermonema sp.]